MTEMEAQALAPELVAEEPISEEKVQELSALIYSYLGGQITLADTKAQLILAADALLLASVATFNQGIVSQLFDPTTSLVTKLTTLLTFIIFGALVASIYYALRVARPTLPLSKKPNFFYFADVTRFKEADFRRMFTQQTEADVTDALLYEVWLLSLIAYRKFDRVRLSINWLIAAFVLWGIQQGLTALFG